MLVSNFTPLFEQQWAAYGYCILFFKSYKPSCYILCTTLLLNFLFSFFEHSNDTQLIFKWVTRSPEPVLLSFIGWKKETWTLLREPSTSTKYSLWQHAYIHQIKHITMGVNFLSINAKGLNHPAKRKSLWKETLHHRCNILCAQEAHFCEQAPPNCSTPCFPHIFTSNTDSKKCGVFIAIRDTVSSALHQEVKDPQGCYLILLCDNSVK